MTQIKVLLVEDVPLIVIGALTVLNKFAIEIDVAENGKKALERAKEKDYQLVFLDLGLPDMSGIEVANHLRTGLFKTSTTVTIIALTAHTDENYKEACKAVGMNDFLTKPLTETSVKKILKKIVEKNGWGYKWH